MGIWRTVLGLTIELHDLGEIQAIDATGVDRIAASQLCAKRTNYTFKAVKTTILVDCSTGVIIYTLFNDTTTRFAGRLAGTQTEPGYPVNDHSRQGLRLVVASE